MKMQQPKTVDATFYATIEPRWKTYAKDEQGRPILDGARVTGITQQRPQRSSRPGTIVTRLTLRIDAAALLPLQPEAVIHVRAGDVNLIEVEASDPGLDESTAENF